MQDTGSEWRAPAAGGGAAAADATSAFWRRALKMLLPLTSRAAIKAAGQSPVHSAAEGGHAHCLELLLAAGLDVNYRMEPRRAERYRDLRRSALYFAVSNGDAACTGVLLAAGARTDLDPLSCLLVAVRSGRRDLAELLLACRADVNRCFTAVSDTLFPTALQYCLGDEAMMRLLLKHGYDAGKCFQCHHGNAAHGGKIPVSPSRLPRPRGASVTVAPLLSAVLRVHEPRLRAAPDREGGPDPAGLHRPRPGLLPAPGPPGEAGRVAANPPAPG